MRNLSLIVLLFSFSLISCINNCGECFTPPQDFSFDLVDQLSGENLFANGTFDPDAIQVTNSFNEDTPFEFTFVSENNLNLIHIPRIGWTTETVNLRVEIADQQVFEFYVEAERKTRKCCSYTQYHKTIIVNTEFEQDEKTGVFKVFLESESLSQ